MNIRMLHGLKHGSRHHPVLSPSMPIGMVNALSMIPITLWELISILLILFPVRGQVVVRVDIYRTGNFTPNF